MKPHINQRAGQTHALRRFVLTAALAGLTALQSSAATVTLFSDNFDSYTGAATNLGDTTIAVPNTDAIRVDDGIAFPNSPGGLGFNGVQLINWDSAPGSSPNSMLLRPATTFRCNFNARGGTNYVWDFWMKSVKSGTADRGFRPRIVQQGADQNEEDFVIFRSGQGNTATVTGTDGQDIIQAFNGVAFSPSAGAWVTITNSSTGATNFILDNAWNHYKIVANNSTRKFDFYFNDMVNPVNTNVSCAREQSLVCSAIIFGHEGNSADDGYTLIDNVSLTVDGNFVDLASGAFSDGFESYSASTSATTNSLDSDPAGPWITAENTNGNSNQSFPVPVKVQVVDSSVTAPHSGNNCLMVSQGQRAGSTVSWASATNEDVRITWWSKVPVTANNNAIASVYLRVSLYGWEAEQSSASDTILIGYGHRNAAPNGGASSIFDFARWASDWFNAGGAWQDTGFSYTPDVWEEYQLTTHMAVNSYTLVKNPSSTPVTIVKDGQFITAWGPSKKIHTVAFSSSNNQSPGSNPPAFVDDVVVEPYTNTESPQPRAYDVQMPGARFTNYSVVTVPGSVVGGVAVDPRDNTTILFTTDDEKVGAIRRATKVASGNWKVDPTPIATGLYNPSSLTIETNGTVWFVQDQVKGGIPSGLWRIKYPWASNVVERIVADFGASPTNAADQPCDLVLVPSTMTGTWTAPMLAVLDRGVGGNDPNAIWMVHPETNTLDMATYTDALVAPNTTTFGLGALTGNANAIAAVPASGEVVTVFEGNNLLHAGALAFFDGNGTARYVHVGTNDSGHIVKWAAGVAVDPVTGRVWVSDHRATANPTAFDTNQLVSVDPSPSVDGGGLFLPNTPSIQEVTFPNLSPSTARNDRRIVFHEPGMTFSTNGSFLAVSDTGLSSAGGRLIILHNETIVIPPFSITSITLSSGAVNLVWESAGGMKYDVQRSPAGGAPVWTTIASGLLSTTHVDAAPPAGPNLYRVLASWQN